MQQRSTATPASKKSITPILKAQLEEALSKYIQPPFKPSEDEKRIISEFLILLNSNVFNTTGEFFQQFSQIQNQISYGEALGRELVSVIAEQSRVEKELEALDKPVEVLKSSDVLPPVQKISIPPSQAAIDEEKKRQAFEADWNLASDREVPTPLQSDHEQDEDSQAEAMLEKLPASEQALWDRLQGKDSKANERAKKEEQLRIQRVLGADSFQGKFQSATVTRVEVVSTQAAAEPEDTVRQHQESQGRMNNAVNDHVASFKSSIEVALNNVLKKYSYFWDRTQMGELGEKVKSGTMKESDAITSHAQKWLFRFAPIRFFAGPFYRMREERCKKYFAECQIAGTLSKKYNDYKMGEIKALPRELNYQVNGVDFRDHFSTLERCVATQHHPSPASPEVEIWTQPRSGQGSKPVPVPRGVADEERPGGSGPSSLARSF